MEMVNTLVKEKPIVIFSKTSCCMSHSIKSLISGFGANPTVYELDHIPNGHLIEATLIQLGCQPSVPCVFIAQKLVGGENQVMTLHVRNQLIPLLIHAGALWI
ncbi:Thioredoxin superfamily protein [Euphorbia peplus]|nr:Thioredoxin superfamily protein [Euphorbia peplus]